MFKLGYEYNLGVKIYVLEASESFYEVNFYEDISHAHLYDDVTCIEMLKWSRNAISLSKYKFSKPMSHFVGSNYARKYAIL